MSTPTNAVKPHTITMTFAVVSWVLGGITYDLDIPGASSVLIICAFLLTVAAGLRFFEDKDYP